MTSAGTRWEVSSERMCWLIGCSEAKLSACKFALKLCCLESSVCTLYVVVAVCFTLLFDWLLLNDFGLDTLRGLYQYSEF
jgi:hypothetical protein